MHNFYKHGLDSSLEKTAFIAPLAKGLGYVGSKVMGGVNKVKNYAGDAYSYLKKAAPDALKTDYSSAKNYIKNTPTYGGAKEALNNSHTYKYLRTNYRYNANKIRKFNKANPNAIHVGMGTAGIAAGTYLGNRMYRSLKQIGRQIPEDFQNNAQ